MKEGYDFSDVIFTDERKIMMEKHTVRKNAADVVESPS